MRNFLKNKENRIILSVVIITLVTASLPLFSKYCLLGHDSDYHLLRIEALKEGILQGVPFLKVNVLFFGGAGYASSMFYPDFLLYIPALLRAADVPVNASWNIFIFVCIALCFASAFFSAYFMTKSKYAALTAGILFTFCSYHLDDIYVRAAVGEYTAFIFLPLFLYGLYNVCYENMDRPQLLALSLAGILLCHTLTFILCIIIAAVIFTTHYKAFLQNKKLILKLFVTALITVALTAFYLFPMLEQLLTDTFYVSTPWVNPANEARQLSNVFGLVFPAAGIGLILFILPRIIIRKGENDNVLSFADECIALGLVFAVISSSVFPWDIFGKYFSVIQFPWRLFQIVSALFAIAGAVIINRLVLNTDEKLNISSGYIFTVAVLGVMMFFCIYGFSTQDRTYFDYSGDYYDYKPYTGSVIAGEWLPARVSNAETLTDQSEHAYDSDGIEISFERYKNKIIVSADESEYIDVPFIYYKGYAAKGSKGQSYKVDGSAENGLTRVYTGGDTGNITVYYKGTAVQLVSRISSVLMAVFLIVCAVILGRRRKVQSQVQ